MKSPEEIAAEVAERRYVNGYTIGRDIGGVGFRRAIATAAIEADRAQRIADNDGTVHGAVVSALEDRIASDKDEAEGYTYRQRAIDWINAEPDEFWEEFGGPLVDDIERKFILTEPDPA